MSTSVFDIAQARLKAVADTDQVIARQREQLEELRQLREEQDALLLNGTSDLFEAVNKYEGELIRFALRAADKSVTKAADALGVKWQTLAGIIDRRHPELLAERTPIHRRKRVANV